MRIIAAVFIDTIQLREAPGPSTRIDLGGVKFSEVGEGSLPITIEPHLVVLVHRPPDHKGEAALEVTYHLVSNGSRDHDDDADGDGGEDDQIARNVQLLAVEPGKFTYRLVRAELTFDDYGSIEARCRIDGGEPVVVPFTVLPPAED